MRSTLVVLLLSAAFALACAQYAPCITPSQWAGRIFSANLEERFEEETFISYDATNMRVYTYDLVRKGGRRHETFETLALYDKGVGYEVDLDKQECKNFTLDKEDFRPIRIPSNATLIGLATLGGPGGLAVETWAGEFAVKAETVYYVITVTENGCYPVSERLEDSSHDHAERDFFDLVAGDPDPNVFLVPKLCQQ